MLSCKQASQLLSQSLDRRLNWRERLALRFHLAICDVCTRFYAQLKQMRVAVRSLVQQAEQDESLKLSDQARERIARAMDSESV